MKVPAVLLLTIMLLSTGGSSAAIWTPFYTATYLFEGPGYQTEVISLNDTDLKWGPKDAVTVKFLGFDPQSVNASMVVLFDETENYSTTLSSYNKALLYETGRGHLGSLYFYTYSTIYNFNNAPPSLSASDDIFKFRVIIFYDGTSPSNISVRYEHQYGDVSTTLASPAPISESVIFLGMIVIPVVGKFKRSTSKT